VEIERKARQVTIRNIEVSSFAGDVAVISVTCSKGTYIRTLAEDIGKQLGCGAHLIGLRRTATADYQISQAVRRTATADYQISQAVTLEQFEAMSDEARMAALAPPDSAVHYLPAVTLDGDAAFYLLQGQAVWCSGAIPSGLLRLYNEQQVRLMAMLLFICCKGRQCGAAVLYHRVCCGCITSSRCSWVWVNCRTMEKSRPSA